MLNPASASAIFSAFISVIAAACVYPLGRVPDWEDLRPLTWVALTAALVAGSNVTATLEEPDAVHAWMGRLQALFVALHILAWHAYLPGWAKRPVRPLGWALWPLPALGALALLPGAVYGEGISLRPVDWLGVVYREPTLTRLGQLVWIFIGAYALWGIVRVVRWGRTGAPFPLAHLVCTGALFAMGVHDAVADSFQALPTPYLLDFAFYVPVVLFGLVTLRRVADNATDHHQLRLGLESAVVDRSRALAESQVALTRAERLAALGQVSAGVAHELSTPTAAVVVNLQDLSRELSGDEREVVRRSLEEARQGLQRILGLGRQLLLVGRSAGRTGSLSPVSVSEALDLALPAARGQAGTRVVVRISLPAGLWVRAQQEPLVQVLTSLLLNAVQAIPTLRTGTVSARAELLDERVRLVVEDDGVGMSEQELRHVFEPFHGAKPPGMGTGLGLAVARGLVEDMQGTLRFESAVGRGTRAVIELARAEEPAAGGESARPPSPPPRASLLVIDDDPQVLRSMARVLGRHHRVEVAAGVKEGLAALARTRFDLVLCDVVMPSGGGERFWAELLLRDPELTERVVFMTGGALTGEAGAFLRLQPLPILTKPFEVMEVNALLERLAHRPRVDRKPGEEPPATTLGRMGKG